MAGNDELRYELGAAMSGARSPLAAADRLCNACVGLLEVDGASISLAVDGVSRGTIGASGDLSRRLDELQFTFGEGPCLDAVNDGRPVLVSDLDDPAHTRWPAFTGAVLNAGIGALFALPVSLSRQRVGALDLFRNERGPLTDDALAGGLLAAELAALPVLDLLTEHRDWDAAGRQEDSWTQLASIERVEVYQATGMIMAALDVDPSEALVRLRAHAYAHDMTASEVAWSIIDRTVSLDTPDWRQSGVGEGRSR